MVVPRSSSSRATGRRLGTAKPKSGSTRAAKGPATWKARAPTAERKQAAAAFRAQEAALEAQSAAKDVWNKVAPIKVKGSDGVDYAVTFSNDSELGFADAYRVTLESREALASLSKHFSPKPLAEWLTDLGMSEKQFQHFGLRKGIDNTKQQYRATELGPASFERALTGGRHYTETAADQTSFASRINALLPSLMEPILRGKGYPVQVVPELAGGAEVKHASFERSPKAFADYIRRFHHDFDKANTHLHLGLPAKAISYEQGWELTRSLEARTVLALAALSDFAGEPIAINGGSPLAGTHGKGTVKFTPVRHKEPALAHDIELRQWNTIEHGMGLIRSTVELVQNVSRLRTFGERKFGAALDPYLGNISGALEYAGESLAASAQPTQRRLGGELLRLAEEASEGQAASAKHIVAQPLRTKIFKYLNKNSVESLLDTEAFLLPKPKR